MMKGKGGVPRRGRFKGNVVGVANPGYKSSLEVHRRYAMLKRLANDPRSWIRIVDEEDYLHPRRFFRAV